MNTVAYSPSLALLAELGFANWCDGEAYILFGRPHIIIWPSINGSKWQVLVHGDWHSYPLKAEDDNAFRAEIQSLKVLRGEVQP